MADMTKTPELLAPAGSLAMLNTAFDFGATAVYAGQPRYSLRVRNNDFRNLEVLREGIDTAHAQGKHFYLVSNLVTPSQLGGGGSCRNSVIRCA